MKFLKVFLSQLQFIDVLNAMHHNIWEFNTTVIVLVVGLLFLPFLAFSSYDN